MSTVWLNDLSSANLLRKTYISGFLDISGGDMNLRSGNFFTGGTITQNTDSANVNVPSYSMFSVTDLSYMFASITSPMTTFAQDITTNGNTVVKKNLFVTNDASLSGKLALVGDASLNSRLFLGGDASLNSRLFLGGDASLNSKLFLGGDASLNSKLFLGGDASLNSKLMVAGDASLNSKLTVAGDALLNSKLTVAGDALLNSKLTVAGDVSMNGNVGFSPSTSIYGGTISGITNDLHVYGLNVGAGDASLNSKLSVAGDVSMNSNLSVVGDVSMNSNLYIFGKTSAIGAVDISGNVAIGKTGAGVALDVSGSALVSGNVGIGTSENNAKLTLRSDTLSSVLGSTSNSASLVGDSVTDNTLYLNIYNYRHTTGASWTQASTRIQHTVDSNNMSYIEFNPPGNSSDPGGIGIYTASTTGLTDMSGGITIKTNGNVAIGKTTANAKLDVSGGALVSGNVAIGKTSATSALDVSGDIIATGYIKKKFVGFSLTRITTNSTAIAANAVIATSTLFNSTNNVNSGELNLTTGVFTAPVSGYYFFSFMNWIPTGSNIIKLRKNAGLEGTTHTSGTEIANITNTTVAYPGSFNIIVQLVANDKITLFNGALATAILSYNPMSFYTGYLMSATA